MANARELADHLKLNDRIEFMKLVPVEELPALLVTADVGVVPYRPSSATHLMLPVKLLDYAPLKIPVIAAGSRIDFVTLIRAFTKTASPSPFPTP